MPRNRFIGIFCLMTLLNACANYHDNTNEDRQARCKEMKRMIVFNGATTDENEAQVQRAGIDKVNQDYHDDDCS